LIYGNRDRRRANLWLLEWRAAFQAESKTSP
jgi:hypothetical protein